MITFFRKYLIIPLSIISGIFAIKTANLVEKKKQELPSVIFVEKNIPDTTFNFVQPELMISQDVEPNQKVPSWGYEEDAPKKTISELSESLMEKEPVKKKVATKKTAPKKTYSSSKSSSGCKNGV